MTEEPSNYVRNKKTYGTTIESEKHKKRFNDSADKIKIKKSSTLKSDDLPDSLNDNNSNVFKSEKLTNFRKSHKHMTQLQKHIDMPDTLFGLDEYKEAHPQKNFHSIKKANSSSSIADLPDSLEPINDNQFHQLPRPESMTSLKKSMREDSKNPEITNLRLIEKPKEEKKLTEIQENNNETDRIKTEENNIINNKNQEEAERLEKEKKRIEEEKAFKEEMEKQKEEYEMLMNELLDMEKKYKEREEEKKKEKEKKERENNRKRKSKKIRRRNKKRKRKD